MLGISAILSYAVFVYLFFCECVFVYLCICICVFGCQTLGNIVFEVLEPFPFQKYITSWVFLLESSTVLKWMGLGWKSLCGAILWYAVLIKYSFKRKMYNRPGLPPIGYILTYLYLFSGSSHGLTSTMLCWKRGERSASTDLRIVSNIENLILLLIFNLKN